MISYRSKHLSYNEHLCMVNPIRMCVDNDIIVINSDHTSGDV